MFEFTNDAMIYFITLTAVPVGALTLLVLAHVTRKMRIARRQHIGHPA